MSIETGIVLPDQRVLAHLAMAAVSGGKAAPMPLGADQIDRLLDGASEAQLAMLIDVCIPALLLLGRDDLLALIREAQKRRG